MDDEKVREPRVDRPTKLTSDGTKLIDWVDNYPLPTGNTAAALQELRTAQQRLELKIDAVQNGNASQKNVTFRQYLKKNALSLLILAVLLTSLITQAVQIANLRKNVELLSCTMGVINGTVNDTSASITDLKSKITADKKSQFDLIRKLKSQYDSGYEQLLAKEKTLEQLNQTSKIQEIEIALERFWHKILASFN